MCTIADDCARVTESGLKPSFESPHVDFLSESVLALLLLLKNIRQDQKGYPQRGIHEKVSFLFLRAFYTVASKRFL